MTGATDNPIPSNIQVDQLPSGEPRDVTAGPRRRRHRRSGHLARWVRNIRQWAWVAWRQLSAWLERSRQQLMTGFVSAFVHLLLALLLGLWALPAETSEQLISLLGQTAPEEPMVEPVVLTEIVQPESLQPADLDNTLQKVVEVVNNDTLDLLAADLSETFSLELDPTDQDFATLVKAGEFGGRSAFGKKAALRKYGGTVESERAVNDGLIWLAGIQQSDGSWNFGEPGPEASPGSLNRTHMGATSLALLCFLGAGYTQESSGPWGHTVARGLKYLQSEATVRGNRADLRGHFQGNSGMYVQGIATICVCEASALQPGDSKLRRLARQAIHFVENCQHPRGGGWRYDPREAGDTSVVGWQVMALQSARTGGVKVSRNALRGAEKFLKSAQADEGAAYRYRPRSSSPTPTMTAVGLLCRMYLGWRPDNSALERGVSSLSTRGPSSDNIYFNYYATQVLHHWGGAQWKRWNRVMRERLISSQIRQGPAAGSWAPSGPHSRSGGQIYQSTLSLLTLEVYYRHLPMYRQLEN